MSLAFDKSDDMHGKISDKGIKKSQANEKVKQ